VHVLLKVQEALGVVLFVGLTAVVTLQIVSRFVFHSPYIWSEEVARFLFFWVALTGASISVRLRRHFVIDVIHMMAADGSTRMARLEAWLRLFGDIAILGFSVLLFVLGWEYTGLGTFRVGTNSEINMSLVYAAIPFAAGTMITYSLANIVETLTDFRRRDGDGDRPKEGAY
jgi:TRAP-type C4-dicarboxylate transport system permease small subunit